MPSPETTLVAFAPAPPPAHAGEVHYTVDSILGIVVGVVAVVGYLLVLRWRSRGRMDSDRTDRDRRFDDRRSDP